MKLPKKTYDLDMLDIYIYIYCIIFIIYIICIFIAFKKYH